MKISVALCTLNGGKYLEEQLNSIMDQEYNIYEIQIGDDGSSDDTIDIINNFNEKYNNVFLTINETRKGVTKNFEDTIRRCRGEYICLADQDDIWHPDKLKILIPLLKDNPETQGCFTNASFIDEDGNKMDGSLWESLGLLNGEEYLLEPDRLLEHLLRFGNIVTGATMVFKSNAVKTILPLKQRYDYEFHDFIIARQLAINKSLVPVNKELIKYRLHKEQKAGVVDRKYWKELFFQKKNILNNKIENVGYPSAIYHAWCYYKSAVNELRLEQNFSSSLVKRCYIESKAEWYKIKERSWSKYDCLNDNDDIIKKYAFNDKKTLCYFVCYSDKTPDKSDFRYINELRNHFDEVVILTNYELMKDYTDCEFMLLENKGYDFGFLYQAIKDKDLTGYNSVSFVNNSNILLENKNFNNFFRWLDEQDSKFCGLTDSWEAASSNETEEQYHLQSHFLYFKEEAIILLQKFFSIINFERFFMIDNKEQLRQAIINECEIGLTQYMIRNKLKPASWFKSTEFSTLYDVPLHKINLHIMFWNELIEKGYPLIKKRVASTATAKSNRSHS